MTTTARVSVIAAVAAIIIIGFFAYRAFSPKEQPGQSGPLSASYLCNEGKTIDATFYAGKAALAPKPGEPPVPTGSVVLNLNHNETIMTLKQTLSADGVRYANSDESFVFWSKGHGALVLVDNKEKPFIGCIEVASVPEGSALTQTYADGQIGFSIRYPKGFTVDSKYIYQGNGPEKEIHGVKFTIPESLSKGTNLAQDSYIGVEYIPQARRCSPDQFLVGVLADPVKDGDQQYGVASTTGAAAGNRYEETVYSLADTNPCIAVRYFIHYGVIENYPSGTVREFDRSALLAEFDAIRRTLIVNQ